jgi:hypothetical protein
VRLFLSDNADYNPQRDHSSINNTTPIEHELKKAAQHGAGLLRKGSS